MPDPKAVNSMFGRIARRYDRANRVLSGGLDISWRRALVRNVAAHHPTEILDLATGSGDVVFALTRGVPTATRIVGMDFCQPMLDEAEIKKAALPSAEQSKLVFQVGDGLALPLADGQFDAVTISFGLRNMGDRDRSLREMRRVLRPGGRLHVLEFSQPNAAVRPLYFFYLRHIVPRIAAAITRDRAAYVYLNETIEEFPSRDALSAEIRAAGFSDVRATPLTFGTVALHEGVRTD